MNGFWSYRDLLVELIRREILVRYRHSLLGIGWALLQPLGLMLLFTFVFTRAVSLGAVKTLTVPYPLFVYVGVLPWTLFAAGLSGCVGSLAGHRELVTKVYFPHQILPLSAIASAFFDFLVASVLLAVLGVFYHLTGRYSLPVGGALLMLPIVVAIQLLLMVGLGLWLALANLWFRDVKYLFAVGIQMWMFLTNVLYPLPAGDGLLRALVAINPEVAIISACRSIVLDGQMPPAGPLSIAAAVGVGFAVSGWTVFQTLEGRFAERV